MSRIRNVALLLPALVLATGLASAQPGIKISQVDSSGQVTHSTFDPSSGPAAKAPTPGPSGTFKYWDGLPATNYYLTPNYTTSPPAPQIAVGPDDVLTVVNRTIARYPNPNAAGNTGAGNPYAYPPSHAALIDAWLGIQGGGTNAFANLCPSHADNVTCFIDNISIRYDQLQGRFVFLATVTDLEMHMSNWVLILSKWADFACSTTPPPNNPAVCVGTSDLFTNPIVPVFGGPAVGGFNGNWVGYSIPINVVIPTGGLPTGDITAGAPFCNSPLPGGNPASAPPGGGTGNWNVGPGNPAGTPTTGCTNYYPTSARMGLDNDNIILVSPVLDQTQTTFASNPDCAGIPTCAGLPGGAFAGTRVTTVPKLVVYNGTGLGLSQGPFGYPVTPAGGTPVTSLGAVNLADDIFTGTLTGCPTNPNIGLCGANPIPGLTPQTGPTAGLPGFFGYNAPPFTTVGLAPYSGPTSNVPTVIWEPDNLRGRALASFDSQVGVSSPTGTNNTNVQGVITPLDYLVGLLVAGTPGGTQSGNYRQGFWVQPIVFSCPASFIFGPPAMVTFCGTEGGNGTQVPDLPQLGVLNQLGPNANFQQEPRTNASPLSFWGDPQLVGQGPATSTVVGDPSPVAGASGNGFPGPDVVGGGSSAQLRMFVGDGRPQQVIFREGLLYIARAAMEEDTNTNVLGTSTVVYDILKQAGPTCQAGAGVVAGLGGVGPFCTAITAQCPTTTTPGCAPPSPYTTNGVTIPNPVTILETQWYNGTTPSVCPPVSGISGAPPGAGNTSNNSLEPLCDSSGFGFYAPMYDVPANVIGGLATSANQPISPISLFPWLEKLFVGMTTGGTSNIAATFSTNNPSLWDFRPGDDAYDSSDFGYIDPFNGRHKTTTNDPFLCNIIHNPVQDPLSLQAPNATCPVITFGTRGGASTDPNDGSLWLYGEFAKKRFSQSNSGPAVWGTSVANYALDFPSTDAYNNDNSFFVDVQPGAASATNPFGNPFFTWIQIAKNVGIGFPLPGTCLSASAWDPTISYKLGDRVTYGTVTYVSLQGSNLNNQPNISATFWQVVNGNPPVIPPSTGNSSGGTTQATGQSCNLFGPANLVSRSEMAKWIVLAQMDNAQVQAYLLATGGLPGCSIAGTTTTTKGNSTLFPGFTLTCSNNIAGVTTASSFGDGPCGGTGVGACPAGSVAIPGYGVAGSYGGISDDPNLDYIEVMHRRGYTKGCQATGDVALTYCPTLPVSRGQMAVFVIRAKMNNVFPTSLSGIPLQSPYGDNFGSFLGQNPQAVPGVAANGVYFADEPNTDQFFIYIQKMRELRITNGTLPNADPNHHCAGPCYSPFLSITRQEVATFIVRAFFL